MSFSGLLPQTAAIDRLTQYVLDSVAVAGALSPDRQPARASFLRVHSTGASASGTITVTGTVGGVAGTEEAFALASGDDAWTIGASEFTAISGIAVSGLTGGTIEIVTISDRNTPLYQLAAIRAAEPCRLSRRRQNLVLVAGGQIAQKDELVFFGYSSAWTPAADDRVTVGTDIYRITGAASLRGTQRRHHWECPLERVVA